MIDSLIYKTVEIYAIWSTNKGKITEVREHDISLDIINSYKDELGKYFLYDSDFVNDIDAVIVWQVFDKPFSERIKETIMNMDIEDYQKNNVINTCIRLEKYLFKFEYSERLEFILDMLKGFFEAHNNGADKVIKYFDRVISDALKSTEEKTNEYKKKKLELEEKAKERERKALQYWKNKFNRNEEF